MRLYNSFTQLWKITAEFSSQKLRLQNIVVQVEIGSDLVAAPSRLTFRFVARLRRKELNSWFWERDFDGQCSFMLFRSQV